MRTHDRGNTGELYSARAFTTSTPYGKFQGLCRDTLAAKITCRSGFRTPLESTGLQKREISFRRATKSKNLSCGSYKIVAMAEPIIRNAQAGDYMLIEELLADAGLPLDGLNGHDNFRVLCRDGQIVGCAAIERYGKFGLLRSVALESRERRRGLGRQLVGEILQQARTDGIAELILLTTTAAPFFERLGFRVISREDVPESVRTSVEFQGACPASAAVLRLVL